MKREKVISEIKRVLEEYNITRASLFGSFARGEEDEKSDIDILIDPPEGTTLLDLAGIHQDLEDRLGRKVDVVTRRSVKPKLKSYIEADQVQIL